MRSSRVGETVENEKKAHNLNTYNSHYANLKNHLIKNIDISNRLNGLNQLIETVKMIPSDERIILNELAQAENKTAFYEDKKNSLKLISLIKKLKSLNPIG